MKPRYHAPIKFSTSDESDYDYDYSYEDEDPTNEKVIEKKSPPEPIHISSPHRGIRSNILRPIPKMKSPNNGIQRPQTSESMINIENNISQNDKNTQNIETFLNEEHFYTIEMKRFKSLFGSPHKRFLMANQNQLIFDLSIKSKDKLIKLPNKQHLEISKGHTEFSLKSEEQFQKELMKIDFYPPHENDECKRITVVRFNNMKNISFPRKLVSLTSLDDDNFKGHYHVPSIRNTALVVQGTKTPVLSILELEKDRIEIRTNLNIEKEIIFALAITAFLGKNCTEKTSLIQGIKSFSITSSIRPMLGHDKILL